VIVVDTNILLYLLVPDAHTAAATRLFEADSDWASSILWRSEFRNVLAGHLRRGRFTYSEACEVQSRAEELLAAEYQPRSARVLELVQSSDCSAYDCEFIAVAEALDVKLVTMDAKLLRAFPDIAIPL
jgi:predicted nucleic acid-binding protein